MYKLSISPEAKDDLVKIKSNISKERCNTHAAVNLVTKITRKIRGLTEHPEIGAPLSSVLDIQTDFRFLVCNNYLIFYRLENRTIYVSRILYSRRNYMRILFGKLSEDEEI
ncbi:Plasmid stabilization system protein ParE [Evansella caseinilytica]|uniref:Plasmid stabilization system protein ParE n=1 Tax=Evansella caseinilytica TaxID=1503961 RepID=A0A1H3NUU0_9BACI|nr:type II toxin-antitoxin system RelE/ParE family toxin [Evansella caseinilytica]SDY92483.1 Plasmid stabilization system protein ParE [Evansella caseinilytica]